MNHAVVSLWLVRVGSHDLRPQHNNIICAVRPTILQWGVWHGVSIASMYISVDVERMYMVVYKAPLYLYTQKKQSFIYFVVRVVIEEKVKT
jgi:hypothetical protein